MLGVDNAEAIALRILENDVIGVGRPFVPLDLPGSQRLEPFDLFGLVLCVEVEVDTGGHLHCRIDSIQRDIRSHAIAWPEQGEVVTTTLSWNIIEGLGPELLLAFQIVDANDNGPNPKHISENKPAIER